MKKYVVIILFLFLLLDKNSVIAMNSDVINKYFITWDITNLSLQEKYCNSYDNKMICWWIYTNNTYNVSISLNIFKDSLYGEKEMLNMLNLYKNNKEFTLNGDIVYSNIEGEDSHYFWLSGNNLISVSWDNSKLTLLILEKYLQKYPSNKKSQNLPEDIYFIRNISNLNLQEKYCNSYDNEIICWWMYTYSNYNVSISLNIFKDSLYGEKEMLNMLNLYKNNKEFTLNGDIVYSNIEGEDSHYFWLSGNNLISVSWDNSKLTLLILEKYLQKYPSNKKLENLSEDVYVIYDTSAIKSFNNNTEWSTVIPNITKKIYENVKKDKYDFFIIISSNWSGGWAYFTTVSNDWTGNFLRYNFNKFDQSKDYGSDGKLKWVIIDKHWLYENYLSWYKSIDPIEHYYRYYMGDFMHELTHNWAAFFPEKFNDLSQHDELGNSINAGHWEKYLGSWVSWGGDTKTKLVEKNWKYYFQSNCVEEPKNNDYELYAMGLISEKEVKDKLIVINPKMTSIVNDLKLFSKCNEYIEIPSQYISNTYTINDLIDVQWQVTLDFPKNYNVAFVLLKEDNSPINIDEKKALEWISKAVPISWNKSTIGRSTLNNISPIDKTSPIISNVITNKDSKEITIKRETDELATTSVIYTNNNYGYRYISPEILKFPPEFSKNHNIVINWSNDPNIWYYGLDWYDFKIVSIDEYFNIASKNVSINNITYSNDKAYEKLWDEKASVVIKNDNINVENGTKVSMKNQKKIDKAINLFSYKVNQKFESKDDKINYIYSIVNKLKNMNNKNKEYVDIINYINLKLYEIIETYKK